MGKKYIYLMELNFQMDGNKRGKDEEKELYNYNVVNIYKYNNANIIF